MEWEYNSSQFADNAEWAEAIQLYSWRNPLNKGHYERRKGIIYFDQFCYNLIEVQIERRSNMGDEGKGKKFTV